MLLNENCLAAQCHSYVGVRPSRETWINLTVGDSCSSLSLAVEGVGHLKRTWLACGLQNKIVLVQDMPRINSVGWNEKATIFILQRFQSQKCQTSTNRTNYCLSIIAKQGHATQPLPYVQTIVRVRLPHFQFATLIQTLPGTGDGSNIFPVVKANANFLQRL